MNEGLGGAKYLQSVLWLTFIWLEIIIICQHTEISAKGVTCTLRYNEQKYIAFFKEMGVREVWFKELIVFRKIYENKDTTPRYQKLLSNQGHVVPTAMKLYK